jgi:hypothetical protein
MSEEKKAYKPHVRELATRIYVELASRAITLNASGVTMSASAEKIAQLSFQLAEVFQATEDKLNAPNVARTEFKLSSDDIASWTK